MVLKKEEMKGPQLLIRQNRITATKIIKIRGATGTCLRYNNYIKFFSLVCRKSTLTIAIAIGRSPKIEICC